jgi:RNA polymerase-binding transcription factor DksA
MALSTRPRSASLVESASNGDVCEFDVTFSRGTDDRLGRDRIKAITLRPQDRRGIRATSGASVVGVTDADEPTPPADEAPPAPHAHDDEVVDLDAIEADLDAVQTALDRLAAGSYWTDEVTGAPIPVDVLDADPLARRL